jgi:Peptidase family S41
MARNFRPQAAFVLAMLFAASAWSATSQPTARQLADAVASTIAANYHDPALGKRHAAALQAEVASGRLGNMDDPDALASSMTDFLRHHDRHFAVRRTDDNGSGPRVGREPPPAHGIGKVEVLSGNIGYLELRGFADFAFGNPAAPARRAIDNALEGIADTKAVIVDLRHNGGGSPAMVGYLASAFVAPGANIFNTFRWQGGSASEAPADWHATPRPDVPLYILVGPRTASAAESFAYTLKHARRAVIVGEPTAGAANPGQPFDLGNGYSVFVSTGSPINPVTGGNWEGVGVQPDVVAAVPDALEVALSRIGTEVENRG